MIHMIRKKDYWTLIEDTNEWLKNAHYFIPEAKVASIQVLQPNESTAMWTAVIYYVYPRR